MLEDNLRTPSGFAYAVAARAASDGTLPTAGAGARPIEPVLWEVLRAARPRGQPGGGRDPGSSC